MIIAMNCLGSSRVQMGILGHEEANRILSRISECAFCFSFFVREEAHRILSRGRNDGSLNPRCLQYSCLYVENAAHTVTAETGRVVVRHRHDSHLDDDITICNRKVTLTLGAFHVHKHTRFVDKRWKVCVHWHAGRIGILRLVTPLVLKNPARIVNPVQVRGRTALMFCDHQLSSSDTEGLQDEIEQLGIEADRSIVAVIRTVEKHAPGTTRSVRCAADQSDEPFAFIMSGIEKAADFIDCPSNLATIDRYPRDKLLMKLDKDQRITLAVNNFQKLGESLRLHQPDLDATSTRCAPKKFNSAQNSRLQEHIHCHPHDT